MKIKIKVTKQVLADSMFCTWGVISNCMIARAVREIFPDAVVGSQTDYPEHPEWVILPFGVHTIVKGIQRPKLFFIELPHSAIEAIGHFDKATPDERINLPEFSFEVELSNDVINAINIGQAYKVLSESKTLELVSI
jgi:hypothetical protein